MNTFFHKIKLIVKDASLRNRILFVLGAFVVFRLLATIPIPGIDASQLQALLADNQFLGLLNIFSGGGLSGLSLVMLGVGPYITASIIMQLLTIMSPKIKAMYHEEGEIGRQKFTQISRYLTVPLAAIQGFGIVTLLQQQGVLPQLAIPQLIITLIIVTAGSMLITWIGELMSEFGIGNGVSLIIFAGIVGIIPQTVQQLAFTFDMTQLLTYIALAVVAILIIAGVVLVNEAERPVPITYSKHSRGGATYGQTSTYLPLRINQSGVMPIIFALAILLFPQLIASFLASSGSFALQNIGNALLRFVANGWAYSSVYFALVFGFTYFYTAITFDPESTAENLQKSGAFIPGIRPGKQTEEYLGKVVSRITFVGALFLGVIAVIPIAIQSATGITAFALGGTSLLIVVSVVIDVIKKLDAQIAMREY
jgi:preprotein translocase subunit SecY